MKLAGKNALITGGTSGIGEAVAAKLLAQGASVYILGRSLNRIHAAIKRLSSPRIKGLKADVSNYRDLKTTFEKLGNISLDILVNNAGLPVRSIEKTPAGEIEYVVKTNILGYLHTTHFALPLMATNSHIVMLGSLSADVFEEDADIYVATKSAVRGFSNSLRKLLNKRNIKLTEIDPGNVSTNMVTESELEKVSNLKRNQMLKADDIAESIIFALNQPERSEIMSIKIKARNQYLR